MGPANEMNDGIIVLSKTPDNVGCTIKVLHNIADHSNRNHHGIPFVYFNDVKDGAVEVVPF